jgi:poly(3-hydroxybutyrate) depolymerase
MTLMGGPIDTRRNPTAVNKLAEEKGIDWFHRNVIMKVPFPHPGVYRDVYPGFLQLTGFMSMNLDRHLGAHKDFYQHLVKGDGDNAEKHREFYDEYLAVMDLTAEFYLQTVETVFVRHALPKGEMMHRGVRVDPGAIRTCALLTIEGEKDDITGGGQTEAAHDLCTGLPAERKVHYTQPAVGHYGVFNGSRWRADICPRLSDFILTHNVRSVAARAAARPARASDSTQDARPPRTPANGRTIADDLKRITGIGPKLERDLHGQGIFLFHQLAELTETQIDELDTRLATRGRIRREDWVGQARRLLEAV